jgi:sulfite reductase (NADPH) flavoprotein alpha-component
VVDAAGGPAVPVTILFGSQTGNAEGCAKKLAKGMKDGRFAAEVIDLADYERGRLAGERNVLLITSTYGDGEPPDGAADFHEWLMSDSAPRLDGVRYSVLGLGDTEYPDFCKCAIDFDERFAALGAERIHERADCDVDFDEPFAAWRGAVLAALGPVTTDHPAVEPEEEAGYGKKRPFPAPILNNYNLNGEGSARETHHIEFLLEGSGLDYQVGDALGVIPSNDVQMVDEILAALPFNTTEEVPLPGGGTAPLRDALVESYDIRSLTPKMVQNWQERSGSPYLRSLVEAKDPKPLKDFCWGRELIDLVVDHPGDFADAEEFVSVLKKLQPRLYSIASSPNAHPGEVHLTVAIVRYHSHHRDRGGVCTTFLADRSAGAKPGVFVHMNKPFRMTTDGDAPLIMVGPGTGIAPFRAFLEEREVSGAKGANWLFFGNPHRDTDFIYEDELKGFAERGVLTRLDTAFSRDQAHKIYVQDRMLEAGAEMWKWLEEGACFYVCGDASRMAKDVDAALHTIAREHGGLSEAQAAEYIKGLRKEKRYCRDVY